MQLKTCGREGCEPVEQLRGELGPGDYYDVIAANRIEKWGSIPESEKYGVPVRDKVEYQEFIPDDADGHFVTSYRPESTDEVLERYNVNGSVYRQEHCVEITEVNHDNFRICCKTCGKSTGWAQKDMPGMPDAGADWVRNKWNKMK